MQVLTWNMKLKASSEKPGCWFIELLHCNAKPSLLAGSTKGLLIKIVNAFVTDKHMQVSNDLKSLFLEFFSADKHKARKCHNLFKMCAFEGLVFVYCIWKHLVLLFSTCFSIYPDH